MIILMFQRSQSQLFERNQQESIGTSERAENIVSNIIDLTTCATISILFGFPVEWKLEQM